VWTPIGPSFTNNTFQADLTNLGGTCFYRVVGPEPEYAGASFGGLACAQCHSRANEASTPRDFNYDYWVETPHARAFQTLTNANPANATNASCLPCHTTGYGYPNGFTIGKSALEGVQCENCHGPGGVRHRSGGDKAPAIERSAMVCGGCHNNSRYRTYDEWAGSGHAKMNPHVAELLSNPAGDTANMFRCGSCHSGAMRSYLMSTWASTMPAGDEAAREGIACVACHDPHRVTENDHQVRNPLFSTNSYSVIPATNSAGFFAQYNPQINLCGQCHNARGAKWTDTARPPHASPQYNLLLGAIGELDSGATPYQPGAHALLIKDQCVGCHLPVTPPGGERQLGNSGHSMAVTAFDSCLACHPYPEPLVDLTIYAVETQIQELKGWLDFWATTKAPESLRTKYGVRAWEYTSPGELSNPPGITNAGPASVEQPLIPDAIRKARFNLYLVQRDGSFGVHNGPHAIALLDAARNWIQAEIAK
jgi:formate-dependent nitrite reductase cytochrome c552 subunit